MKSILVDSSVWIGYFRGIEESKKLNNLIDNNAICINELILSEIIPSLIMRKENEVINLLNSIEKMKLDIDWAGIRQMQVINLKNGLNRVGIPDLIIAQNAIQNKVELYSFDKHFELMKKSVGLKTFKWNE
jgi:Predicted nucleic acid-binding protein, contains PIN domain